MIPRQDLETNFLENNIPNDNEEPVEILEFNTLPHTAKHSSTLETGHSVNDLSDKSISRFLTEVQQKGSFPSLIRFFRREMSMKETLLAAWLAAKEKFLQQDEHDVNKGKYEQQYLRYEHLLSSSKTLTGKTAVIKCLKKYGNLWGSPYDIDSFNNIFLIELRLLNTHRYRELIESYAHVSFSKRPRELYRFDTRPESVIHTSSFTLWRGDNLPGKPKMKYSQFPNSSTGISFAMNKWVEIIASAPWYDVVILPKGHDLLLVHVWGSPHSEVNAMEDIPLQWIKERRFKDGRVIPNPHFDPDLKHDHPHTRQRMGCY